MKFSLANIDAYTPANVPETVEMADPKDWRDVAKIAKGIRNKLVEQIKIAKADEVGWKTEFICCTPQTDNGSGLVYFVHADMYAMFTARTKPDSRSKFDVLTWESIHEVVGDELG